MKLAILGATGRTGRHLVELALAAGHEVRVLVRTPDKLRQEHERLARFAGDATDAAAIRAVTAGCDAVLSALGPTPGHPDVCGTAAAHVVAAGVRRYVAISGAGLDIPGDDKDLVGKFFSFVVRVVTPAIVRDKAREHALLAASPVAWTLVRAPRLTDRPPTGAPKIDLVRAPGASVSRADLAAFVLAAVRDDALIGKAPFIAS